MLRELPFLMVITIIMNEEGKLMQLPLNPEATALWRATFDKR